MRLREEGRPVFVRTTRPDSPTARGFWAVGNHASIVDISRRRASSGPPPGTQMFDQTKEMREYMRLRKIVSASLTKRLLNDSPRQ